MSDWLKRIRYWKMRMPSSWGLGQAEIHSSLLVMLTLISGLIACLSYTRPGFAELRTLAISLPIVWVVSLAVRIAAQQLSIGKFAFDAETVVGPSGNLQTDYEYLPPSAIHAYAVTGQLASLGLISLGLVVNAAMSPTPSDTVTIAELLNVHGGWASRAWASQIMWVNVFLFALHLLPTVPFDMRATVFACFSMRSRNTQEPFVFRSIASFDSHLSATLFGVGLSACVFSWAFDREILGLYGAIAASVYLFVASQWEAARAEELEEQYVPNPTRGVRHASKSDMESQLPYGISGPEDTDDYDDPLLDSDNFGSDLLPSTGGQATQTSHSDSDVDEILRKLHKQGTDSLTLEEHQILLSASRDINEKRG